MKSKLCVLICYLLHDSIVVKSGFEDKTLWEYDTENHTEKCWILREQNIYVEH